MTIMMVIIIKIIIITIIIIMIISLLIFIGGFSEYLPLLLGPDLSASILPSNPAQVLCFCILFSLAFQAGISNPAQIPIMADIVCMQSLVLEEASVPWNTF